jgi:hypothetical protein
VRCAIDPCHFYWSGRSDAIQPFVTNGARASELMGAMLNVQLDRIDGMVKAMRAERRRVLEGTKDLGKLGLRPAVHILPTTTAPLRLCTLFRTQRRPTGS